MGPLLIASLPMSILIVDDAPDNLLLLQAILGSAGHTAVLTAESAHEAFRRLGMDGAEGASEKSPEVDLILMDLMMPEMDGLEACRRIKAVEHLRDIPIIMVTANTDPEDLQAAFAAGAMDYITKPLKKMELLARVTSALNLKREMDARKARERELEQALSEVKVLRGFIPICASCKKIRNDQGYWQQIETYIQNHSEALFSHGMCQECMKKFYPEFSVE